MWQAEWQLDKQKMEVRADAMVRRIAALEAKLAAGAPAQPPAPPAVAGAPDGGAGDVASESSGTVHSKASRRTADRTSKVGPAATTTAAAADSRSEASTRSGFVYFEDQQHLLAASEASGDQGALFDAVGLPSV
jgi:hypothetical protein